MSFGNPWFLVGALSILIPVLLHLMRREPRARIPFASLMFLKCLPQPVQKRRQMRYWLLFLLRAGALLLLALAFARPALRGAEEEEGSALVLLVDCSLSMRYGERFARAQDEAEAILARAPETARVGLIGFSTRPEAQIELTRDRARVRAAVRALHPTSRATDYHTALQAALALMEGATEKEKVVYLLSDLQRSGWRETAMRLPEEVRLIPVDVASDDGGNHAIVDVRTPASSFERRLLVRVGNFRQTETRLTIRLFVNDRLVQQKALALAPQTIAPVEFADFPLDPGFNRLRLETERDRLPEDDLFHLVVRREAPKKVLLLGGAAQGARFYLRQALLAGDVPVADVSALRAAEASRGSARDEADVLIVADPSALDPDGERALQEFVMRGGGAILALDPMTPVRFERLSSWLGVRVEGAETDALSFLTGIEVEHPIFRVFADARRANFADVRFWARTRIALEAKAEDALVLARFHDGRPALVECARGRGRVFLLAFGLDARGSTLPLTPLYAPLIHQMVSVLRSSIVRPYYRVGEIVTLERGDGNPAHISAVLETPTGQRVRFAEGAEVIRFAPEAAGIYRLRRVDGEVPIAVNIEAGESDLTKMKEEEFVRRATGTPSAARPASGGGTSPGGMMRETQGHPERSKIAWGSRQAGESSRGLAPLILLAVMMLILSEAIVADRTVRRMVFGRKEGGR